MVEEEEAHMGVVAVVEAGRTEEVMIIVESMVVLVAEEVGEE